MSIRKGILFSLSERYILIVVGLGMSMILARLLTPEEIGIYSIVLAIIGIAQVLREFGVGSFLIQEKNLTDDHIRTAYGLSLIIGFVLLLLTWVTAPYFGDFYRDPRLAETMKISALNFLVLPFCSISIALLRRDMLFKRIALANVIATIAGAMTGISLAYRGFGPNSMAYAAVVTNLVVGFMAWALRYNRKLYAPSLSEWRAMVNYGSQSSVRGIVASVAMNANDLALGRILGLAPVAMISRAQGLMNLFDRDVIHAIRGVMFPAFAKAHREGDCVDTVYINSVMTVTVFAWPFYGFAALFGEELIYVMFGPQWNEAVQLVPYFCLAGAVAAVYNLASNAVLAVGRFDLVTKLDLTIHPLRVIIIVGAAIYYETLLACAIGFLFVIVVSTPFVYWLKDKCIQTDYSVLLRGLLNSGLVTLCALTPPFIFSVTFPEQQTVTGKMMILGFSGITAIISWLISLYLFKHPFRQDPFFQRFDKLIKN